MKKKEKSLTKSFRWTSWVKAENKTYDPQTWTNYMAGNFTRFDALPDPKEVEYSRIHKQDEYKLLKNLRKSSNEEDDVRVSGTFYGINTQSRGHAKLTGINGV